MKRFVLISILLAASAALAMPAAEASGVRTVRPGPDAAQIVGSPGFPNRDIFAVKFTAIDGTNIPPRDIMWLAPGTYRITVRIDALFTRPPIRRLPRDEPEYNVIELELEAGKSYHIRGRYHRHDRDNPYSVILFKVE